jgi:hypothetical protein
MFYIRLGWDHFKLFFMSTIPPFILVINTCENIIIIIYNRIFSWCVEKRLPHVCGYLFVVP